MPKKIDPEVRSRAGRLVNDHLAEYSSLTAASAAVAKQVGVSNETVRRWVLQAQVDGGQRRRSMSEGLAEIKALKAKVRRLEEDNAILKAATVLFVGELDPATADHGFHRRNESRRSRGRADHRWLMNAQVIDTFAPTEAGGVQTTPRS
ncbi:transposase [Kribbella sp. CWNU-51]